LLLAYQDSNLE